MLVDVLDHPRQCCGLAGSSDACNQYKAAGLHRDFFQYRRQIKLGNSSRLIWNGTHRVAERASLLIHVDAESPDARHADGEVALFLFRELLHLTWCHQLLGKRLEIFGAHRRPTKRLELAVDA